jgi:hypothetical protein
VIAADHSDIFTTAIRDITAQLDPEASSTSYLAASGIHDDWTLHVPHSYLSNRSNINRRRGERISSPEMGRMADSPARAATTRHHSIERL